MKLHRHLNNESGIATILMVVAGLVIVGLVGINFIIEQQNKHQGSAVTVNAEQAQANAEAGFRYATKCLTRNDPACACNVDAGSNGCTSWTNMQNFLPRTFGSGTFEVSFNNLANCSIGVSSTGIVNNTRRTINEVLSRNAIGGAVSAVTVANPQSFLGPTIGPIAVLNQQRDGTTASGNTFTYNNYTTPVGSNLVLVVMAGSEGNGNNARPSGVTFGGTPMIEIDRLTAIGSGSDPGVGLYYLSVASGVTGNVIATFQGNQQNRAIGILTLSNAVAPPEASVTVPDDNDPVTGNITTLSTNGMIVSGSYFKQDSDLVSLGTGHNEITNFNDIPNNEAEGAMGYRATTTIGTYTGTGYVRSGGSSDNIALILAAFPHANKTISMNYTVPAGSNQILVVVVGAEDGIAPVSAGSTVPVSATFNGIPMNLVTTQNVTSGSEAGLGMFWLAVNAGDTGTIVGTYTDSAIDNKTIHAYTLNNATGPPERIVANSSTSPPDIIAPFLNTLTAGAMIASGGYQGNNTVIAPLPLAGTHVINTQVPAPSSRGVMGSRPVPVAETPNNIGWNATFNRMALILASFPPAGGGGLCTALP